MKILTAFLNAIDGINHRLGKIFCWLSLVIMVLIVYDVFMRYFVSKPTIWVDELSEMLLLIMICIGGGTALLHNMHVKVGLLSDRLTPKTRALIDLITHPVILIICFILITDGTRIAWDSYLNGSRSDSMFRPLLWPIQTMIPLAGLLLGIQVIAKLVRDFVFLISGIHLESKWAPREGNIL
jgi:TRAP-type mannitol/chloroaromatic compound transport system permease small subunit